MSDKEFWRRSMTHVAANLTSAKIVALHRFLRLRGIAILLTGSLAGMNVNAQEYANSYECVGRGLDLQARVDTPSMYHQSTYMGRVRLVDSPLGHHLVLALDGGTDGQMFDSLILPKVTLGDSKSVKVSGMFVFSRSGGRPYPTLPGEREPARISLISEYTPVTCEASYVSEPETRKPPY